MSNCDDSFKQIQDLQEQNRQQQDQLAEAERLRKAAGVITRADEAMYEAKHGGKNRHALAG